jgi:ComF family protein
LKCGGELINTQAQYCRNCEKNAHVYTQNKALFRYSGGMKNAMYRFKYSNRRCYAEDFARHTVASYGAWIKEKGIEAIIPVPMNEKKKKRRGYNQAEEYARELGKLLKIPVETGIIRRDEDTAAMKQLNRLKRKKNLLKAFTLAKNVVQFRKVLIVDDIYTTGTTLDEVSKVLKGGGVTEVYGMCICIGMMQ